MQSDRRAFGQWLKGLIEDKAGLTQREMVLVVGYRHPASVNKILSGQREAPASFWVNALVFLAYVGVFEHPVEVLDGLALLGLAPGAVLATVEATALTPTTQAGYRATAARGERWSDAKAWFLEWLREWNQPHVAAATQGVRLPHWYVQRPADDARLKARLLGSAPAHPRCAVLWGMGGVGKTVLVQALALDPQVLDRYHNGVLWATLGPAGEPRAWLRAWCRELGLSVPEDEPVWGLHARVRQAVNAPWRRFLIVLDDVWRAEDTEPLLVGGPECGALLTARERHVAQKLGLETALVEVEEMTPEEAGALVQRRLGNTEQVQDAAARHELVRLVDRLPLALELGAAVANVYGWRYVLEALRRDERAVQVLRLGRPERRQHSLEWTLRVSYERLSPPAQRLFERLGKLALPGVFFLKWPEGTRRRGRSWSRLRW